MKKLRHKEVKKVAQCYIVLLILDSILNLPDFIGPHWVMLPPQCNVAYQSKTDMYDLRRMEHPPDDNLELSSFLFLRSE